jgi:hypothetical protein
VYVIAKPSVRCENPATFYHFRKLLHFSLSWQVSQFQNSVSFGTGFRKSGLKPAFSIKFKIAVPKPEVLEQPQI